VALPAPLVGHASLDKDIVIAGLRDRLEIWDRESWHRQLAHVEGSAEVVAERIANART
jgi:DNA-binding transcriptional regulator/RsmH inhibitor MraZ